jgi:hypothetical protein
VQYEVRECEHEEMCYVLPNTLIDFIGMIMLISLIFNLYLQKKLVFFFFFEDFASLCPY